MRPYLSSGLPPPAALALVQHAVRGDAARGQRLTQTEALKQYRLTAKDLEVWGGCCGTPGLWHHCVGSLRRKRGRCGALGMGLLWQRSIWVPLNSLPCSWRRPCSARQGLNYQSEENYNWRFRRSIASKM